MTHHPWSMRWGGNVDKFGTFSFPEPMMLLVCARDRDLWQGPKQEVRKSRTFGFCAQPQKFETITVTIGYKNGQLLRLRVTWSLPEVSIPGAEQKDRGLWGREWIRQWRVLYYQCQDLALFVVRDPRISFHSLLSWVKCVCHNNYNERYFTKINYVQQSYCWFSPFLPNTKKFWTCWS